jgi:hypothetical protein
LVPIDRLAAVLGMMGSVHDAEVLAAARHAERIRSQAGLTWAELLAAARGPSPEPPRPAPPRDMLADWPSAWRAATHLCLCADAGLSDKDFAFLQTVSRYTHQPSPKQLAWLHRIVTRIVAAA